MQNREVAEQVIKALFDVAGILTRSTGMIDACVQEGKASKEEANAYRTTALNSLDELLQAVIGPIYETHPDLRPTCSCCTESAESKENPQP